MRAAHLAALLSLLVTSGCAMVGPKYVEPTVETAEEWSQLDDPTLSSEPLLQPEWWSRAFQDPILDRLVEGPGLGVGERRHEQAQTMAPLDVPG